MNESPTATPPSDARPEEKRKPWTMVKKFATYFEMKARGELDKPESKPVRVPVHLFMGNSQDVERPSLEALEEFLCCSLESDGADPSVSFVKTYQDAEGSKTYLVYSSNSDDRQPGVSYVISKQEHLGALENDLRKTFPGFYVKPRLVVYPLEGGLFRESGMVMLWNSGKVDGKVIRRYY